MGENKKISYLVKDETRCPICDEIFKREEMLSGRGRLIAKDINAELRRTYDDNAKFGKLYPSAYTITVCPNCWYSTLPADFKNLPNENIPLIRDLIDYRKTLIKDIFTPIVVDFYQSRELITGTASYILATSCYSFFPPAVSPTIKRGIFTLRAAWLFGDLAEENPDIKEKFFKIQEIFYIKSKKYYSSSYQLMITNKERMENVNLGPDTDKNYGYDGFMYLMNYLNFKMAYLEEDVLKKGEIYKDIKRNIGKIFGIGKASKEKPGPLLSIVRNLYDEVTKYIDEIEESLGMKLED